MEKAFKVIDWISDRSGWLAAWMLPLLVAVMTFEVIMRYAFNSPTDFSYEASIFLMVGFSMLGGAHAMLHRSHVTVDILWGHLGPRGRFICSIIGWTLFFIYLTVLVVYGGRWAWDSVLRNEHTDTYWAPILWPVKMTVPIGAFLLLLQGIAQFFREMPAMLKGGKH